MPLKRYDEQLPDPSLDAPLWRAIAYTLLGGLSALGLSLFAATVMAGRISRPVANLSRHAAALAEGQMVEPEKYRITEIETVVVPKNAGPVTIQPKTSSDTILVIPAPQ